MDLLAKAQSALIYAHIDCGSSWVLEVTTIGVIVVGEAASVGTKMVRLLKQLPFFSFKAI
jgi:hypothetical protein